MRRNVFLVPEGTAENCNVWFSKINNLDKITPSVIADSLYLESIAAKHFTNSELSVCTKEWFDAIDDEDFKEKVNRRYDQIVIEESDKVTIFPVPTILHIDLDKVLVELSFSKARAVSDLAMLDFFDKVCNSLTSELKANELANTDCFYQYLLYTEIIRIKEGVK